MDPVPFIFKIAILIFSIVLHEVSHGLAALALGDNTAKHLGRLTLNPIKHLDLWGSVIVPLFLMLSNTGIMFGWAKPVPYNPYNLRNQKYGPAIVGVAGPLSNILIAVVFGLSLRVLSNFSADAQVLRILQGFREIFLYIVQINLLLAVFNLVPIPPLDGSKLLFAFLPYRYKYVEGLLEQYGMFLLLFFIFFGFHLIFPIIDLLFRLIVGQKLFL
ncbi:MAG: site-2 protease family protein [bacterium]|nr:site-2 protease family protein [bacterium]